ncbi:hypothetical protein GCM10012289_27090 [Nonomuraea cavernae]|uniref:Uncharacterized protein n=1 Tax=Nonomuraea cavernae TaxID=2045107 RepID=A0A917YVV8_9ACTN|nr:hypothetical protein GCM10012289_27090 [Nonomuraea cavernae]
MTRVSDCLSFHVAPLQPDHMRLVWRDPTRAENRVRVTAHTCDCVNTVYELCHAGGQAHIRRTRRGDGPVQVHESHRWLFKEAQAVWLALLDGRAR